MLRRFLSITRLGIQLIIHFFHRAFGKPNGLTAFEYRYSTERLSYISYEDRLRLPDFMGCINCAVCEAVCPVLSIDPEGLFQGPNAIASSISRLIPDIWAGKDTFYRCVLCGACTAVCPNSVPVADMVRFARKKIIKEGPSHLPQKTTAIIKEIGSLQKWPQNLDGFVRHQAQFIVYGGPHPYDPPNLHKICVLLENCGVSISIPDCPGKNMLHEGFGVEGYEDDILLSKALNQKKAQNIIVLCPWCYMRLIDKLPVVFILDVLSQLVDKLPRIQEDVVYHEACVFSRRYLGMGYTIREFIKKVAPNCEELTKPGESLCTGGETLAIAPEIAVLLSQNIVKKAQGRMILTECSRCVESISAAGGKASLISEFLVSLFLQG